MEYNKTKCNKRRCACIRILFLFPPSTSNRPAEARPPEFIVILTAVAGRDNEFPKHVCVVLGKVQGVPLSQYFHRKSRRRKTQGLT